MARHEHFWINRMGLLRYRFTIETVSGTVEGSRPTHRWALRAARRKIHQSHVAQH